MKRSIDFIDRNFYFRRSHSIYEGREELSPAFKICCHPFIREPHHRWDVNEMTLRHNENPGQHKPSLAFERMSASGPS